MSSQTILYYNDKDNQLENELKGLTTPNVNSSWYSFMFFILACVIIGITIFGTWYLYTRKIKNILSI